MGDATVDVIATLPNLKELSIRTTGVTDAAVDKILAMPQLQSLTFKDNGAVTDEGAQKTFQQEMVETRHRSVGGRLRRPIRWQTAQIRPQLRTQWHDSAPCNSVSRFHCSNHRVSNPVTPAQNLSPLEPGHST